jgi:hypothetical protein
MAVLKTTSPAAETVAPKEYPLKTDPSSRTSLAGILEFMGRADRKLVNKLSGLKVGLKVKLR